MAFAMSFKEGFCSLAGNREPRAPQAMERGPPPASLPRTAPKTGIQTHPRPSGRGRDARGPGRWQRRGRGPATEAELRTPITGKAAAAAAGRCEPVGPGRPLPPPKPKPCCGASDPRPELQPCTEADRMSRTRHPRASQRRQRAPPTRRDSAARPPHETALEPSRGSAASPQGPAQLRPSKSRSRPRQVA